jgi:SAM-dependent methyltransferase
MVGMHDRWDGLPPGQRPFREAAWIYAEYRYRPTGALARLLAAHLVWSSADRVLDLGAGPAHVSLVLAPYVGEVDVMDLEEAMIEEGRRRAADAGVADLSFVVGGSDDLTQLASDLGQFAAVVISQAFHWMADQDSVLRALDRMLDDDRGAVVLVGYVKDPDYNASGWIVRRGTPSRRSCNGTLTAFPRPPVRSVGTIPFPRSWHAQPSGASNF